MYNHHRRNRGECIKQAFFSSNSYFEILSFTSTFHPVKCVRRYLQLVKLYKPIPISPACDGTLAYISQLLRVTIRSKSIFELSAREKVSCESLTFVNVFGRTADQGNTEVYPIEHERLPWYDIMSASRTEQIGEVVLMVTCSRLIGRLYKPLIMSHSVPFTFSLLRLISAHRSVRIVHQELTFNLTIMVRHYKRKTVTNYTESDLEKALVAVRTKELKPSAAAQQFNIPVATLYARLSGIRGNGPRGAKTILSEEEESFLVQTIEIFEQWQLPLLRKNVIDIGRVYMLELGKKVDEKAQLTEWFISFMARHRDLKLAKCENLEKARSVSCTPLVISKYLPMVLILIDQNDSSSFILEGWFETLHGVLTKHKLLDRPNAIFNVDESGFFDDPGRRSVVVKRSTKHVTASQSGTGKEMTTVLMCTSASGRYVFVTNLPSSHS